MDDDTEDRFTESNLGDLPPEEIIGAVMQSLEMYRFCNDGKDPAAIVIASDAYAALMKAASFRDQGFRMETLLEKLRKGIMGELPVASGKVMIVARRWAKTIHLVSPGEQYDKLLSTFDPI